MKLKWSALLSTCVLLALDLIYTHVSVFMFYFSIFDWLHFTQVFVKTFENISNNIRKLCPLWVFTCPSLHEKDSGDWQEVRAAQQQLLPSLHGAGGETDRLDDGQLLSWTLGWRRKRQAN